MKVKVLSTENKLKKTRAPRTKTVKSVIESIVEPIAIEPVIEPAIEPTIEPTAIEPTIEPTAIKKSIKPVIVKPKPDDLKNALLELDKANKLSDNLIKDIDGLYDIIKKMRTTITVVSIASVILAISFIISNV